MLEVSSKNPTKFSRKKGEHYNISILSSLVRKTPASHLAVEVLWYLYVSFRQHKLLGVKTVNMGPKMQLYTQYTIL